jgi:hypothetical protein
MYLLFIAISIASIFLFYKAYGQNIKLLLLHFTWFIIVGIIAATPFLQNTTVVPPRFLLVMLPSIAIFAYSFLKIKNTIPNQKFLIMTHALRLPIEIVLYILFLQKKIPEIMTFSGLNFDILMGISAILILIYIRFINKKLPKLFLIIWNSVGIFLLVNIVMIALLSAPLPIQQFGFAQPNIAILFFPYTYLPCIVVPIVFIAHIMGLRHWCIL